MSVSSGSAELAQPIRPERTLDPEYAEWGGWYVDDQVQVVFFDTEAEAQQYADYCIAADADRNFTVADLAVPGSDDEGLRDHAYYFGFTQTGVGVIDRILSEVCRAGKGHHSTEFWQDEDPAVNGGKSYEESIQAAADAAAAAIRRAAIPPANPTPPAADRETRES